MATLTETISSLAQPNDTTITPPPTQWSYLCHPRVKELQDEVDGYFLENWKFPSFKAVRTFLDAKFSEVTCLYFPLALDDRIHFACRLLTVLFLIDDVLEHMSFADGEAYNNRLIPISRGDVLPDRTKPEEFILYDLWESMRAHDAELANEVLEPTFVFMRAQTDRARLTIHELGHYLEYREKDVGKALLSALMRFSMGLRFSADELQDMKALEANCAKQLSVVNDIYIYDKEEEASRTGHKEGAFLCSAVKVLAEESKLGIPATKRVLWSMTREWETVHDEIVAEKIASPDGCSEAAKAYMKGLEYQMSGNEQWSKTTRRYN
ncbi:hypothetical protein N7449_005922 [Penicillium cf. viridicatum]|uniref:Terpene synthase n=1 Tax=Penicillium cf. viridicatum TaxID=2972119 RepID=A0A9W9MGY5_9EURO|nr:hypothetical protein N7449_005922 [Penicillium cf. viridicatum]